MARRSPSVHYTPFQEWIDKSLEKRGVNLKWLADQTGLNYENLWKVARGNPERYPSRTRLDYHNTRLVGASLSDESGALKAAGYDVDIAVPLLSRFGAEIDATPYLYALGNVQAATAGLTRLPDASAPGEDIRPGGPVKAIRIVGDCMEPLLSDGDVALVLPDEMVRDGDAVFALVDGGTTACKRARITESESWLESADGGRIEETRFIIVGVVAHKITRV